MYPQVIDMKRGYPEQRHGYEDEADNIFGNIVDGELKLKGVLRRVTFRAHRDNIPDEEGSAEKSEHDYSSRLSDLEFIHVQPLSAGASFDVSPRKFLLITTLGWILSQTVTDCQTTAPSTSSGCATIKLRDVHGASFNLHH